MKTEKPEKKGFIAILKEAFTKSGGCCGAGQTCGGPDKAPANDRAQAKEVPKAKDADKPAQK